MSVRVGESAVRVHSQQSGLGPRTRTEARCVLTVEELFDEVYVGEDHSPAAVALEVQSVEGLSARARG